MEKNAIRQQVYRFGRQNGREASKKEQREIQKMISAENDSINREKRYNLRGANAEEALIALLMTNPDTAQRIFKKLSPDKFITTFNRKIYETLKERCENGYDFSIADISGKFSDDEISSIARILASHPRENDPEAAAKDYIQVLDEESQKMTPEQLAGADEETIMAQLKKLREKKK